jgi:hypothetical protein
MVNFPNYRLGAAKVPCINAITSIPITDIKLFPNPVVTTTTLDYGSIDWSGVMSLSYSIIDYTGKEIFTKELGMYGAVEEIDMSGYVSGLYIVQLKNRGISVWSGKVVKE